MWAGALLVSDAARAPTKRLRAVTNTRALARAVRFAQPIMMKLSSQTIGAI